MIGSSPGGVNPAPNTRSKTAHGEDSGGLLLFGPLKEPAVDHHEHAGETLPPDLTFREICVLSPIAVLCLVIGLKPSLLLDAMDDSITTTLAVYEDRMPEMADAFAGSATLGNATTEDGTPLTLVDTDDAADGEEADG